MTDREKVIKKAERIICSTVDRDMIDSFCDDVIDLLKEQEPVNPIEQTETITRYKCGFCGNRLYLKEHKFCHWCGKAVKWDE